MHNSEHLQSLINQYLCLSALSLVFNDKTKELDRRRVNKTQSTNQNKGLNNDVQNACELLIIEILQNLLRLNQA